jgi:release factor glutamine methyltransferase
MPSPIKQVFFEGYVFRVDENVYEPAEDSFLFAENLGVEDGEAVLDIGTGCGILGIVAAEKAAKVVAVDINPYAVRCAKENAKLNRVADRMIFVQGDLFAPVKTEENYDLILFNAPYLPSESFEAKSWLGSAWAGGATGRSVVDCFICKASEHLREHGRILLMQSTLSDVDETFRRYEKNGLNTSIVVKRALPFFEEIVLVRAER